MSVQRTFTDWARSNRDPLAEPYTRCSPNVQRILEHAVETVGGRSVGCHFDRHIGSSGRWSDHAFGAAVDWRYYAKRNEALDYIGWVIDHSLELGVQAIHDYVGQRIWRAGRTDDPNDRHTSWWKRQRKSGSMGASWATWMHIATTPEAWGVDTPIEDRIEPIELIDMSSWNLVESPGRVPNVPIVHRTNAIYGHGKPTADPLCFTRLGMFSQRTDIFGGYVPLVGDWDIGQQMQIHFNQMDPWWRPGAFSQLDIERFDGHDLIEIDQVIEAIDMHEAHYGPGRWIIYINPLATPELFAQIDREFPSFPLWMPGYRRDETDKLDRFDPIIWQYSDTTKPEGMENFTPVNRILEPELLVEITQGEESSMFQYRHKDFADVFIVGAGAIHMTPDALALSEYAKVRRVKNEDHTFLRHVCRAAGFDYGDLTPMTPEVPHTP